MTCTGCEGKIKNELLKLGDVLDAEIQLSSPQATIHMTNYLSLPVLQQAIQKAGNYIIREAEAAVHTKVKPAQETTSSYWPIFLIFLYITGITFIIQLTKETFVWMEWMSHFMAGFFLVFSFFKLMKLKGFAEGYSSYDIIARRVPVYGYVYPFIELMLGLAFLTAFAPLATNIVTFLVMSISTAGVVKSIMKQTPFQCACLGTVIQLPLSKVTLFEDILMVAMSAVMIINILM